MLEEAILAWFNQIQPLPADCRLHSLSDGHYLQKLLHKIDPQAFPESQQLSPQKNFTMEMMSLHHLIESLKNCFEDLQLDPLKICNNKNQEEIMKLVGYIVKILLESPEGQDSIRHLQQQHIDAIVEFIGLKETRSDQVLLEKIDELEIENSNLKGQQAVLEKQNLKLQQKLTDSDNLLKTKENEVNELKINLNQKEQLLENKSSDLIEKLKKKIGQQQKEIKSLLEEKEIFLVQLEDANQLEKYNKELSMELMQRNKLDKQFEEMKHNLQMQKSLITQKEAQIVSQQNQIKQFSKQKQQEEEKAIQLELSNEQLKQEVEDINRVKNREIYQLQQQINEMQQHLDKSLGEQNQSQSQETQRSSYNQQSPRNLDFDLNSIIENSGGYLNEHMVQELQHQQFQKDLLYQEKIKTLECQQQTQKEKYNRCMQDCAILQERLSNQQKEIEKMTDGSHQLQMVKEYKQQNMLLISVIDELLKKQPTHKHQHSDSIKIPKSAQKAPFKVNNK